MPHIRDLFSLLSSLNGIIRFSMFKLFHKETVLEHLGMCGIFCLVYGWRCNAICPGFVDIGILLSKALVHDWDETLTGDVARPTKYYSKILRNELANFEHAGVANIARALAWPGLQSLHNEAKKGREGLLVSIADYACAVHRVFEETMVHHNYTLLGTANDMGVVPLRLFEEIKYTDLSTEIRLLLVDWVEELEAMRHQVALLDRPSPELHNAHRSP
jgi:5'-deoxynucleotidase YfbR-like HD superfamily hydrolase